MFVLLFFLKAVMSLRDDQHNMSCLFYTFLSWKREEIMRCNQTDLEAVTKIFILVSSQKEYFITFPRVFVVMSITRGWASSSRCTHMTSMIPWLIFHCVHWMDSKVNGKETNICHFSWSRERIQMMMDLEGMNLRFSLPLTTWSRFLLVKLKRYIHVPTDDDKKRSEVDYDFSIRKRWRRITKKETQSREGWGKRRKKWYQLQGRRYNLSISGGGKEY